MALKEREEGQQQPLWIAGDRIAASPGHPFYRCVNRLLAEGGFDRFAEGLCRKFYAERLGRPSVPPGVYFRMLLIGYFEGIDSERGIAWRCADSLALREFLGYPITENTPDHSTLSVIRRRLDLETHQEIFAWVLRVLAERGLLKGKTIGIDATTLEANAALRSIVRRDTGDGYEAFLVGLAKASGIETPRREDLAKLDRERPKKGSNAEWVHPGDPDAKIAKMKDGRTHLAHKAEHAVDMDTGAVVAVTLQPADRGDTTTVHETAGEAIENLQEVEDDPHAHVCSKDGFFEELVTDKGYHSNETLRGFSEINVRTYVSEPDRRGRRDWRGRDEERLAVYGNRRRIRGERGKRLLRKRGELVERSFAHCYETGAMRRTHLRGHPNILKRLLVHVAAFNLSLVMRVIFGIGKPRGLGGLSAAALRSLMAALNGILRALIGLYEHCAFLGCPTGRLHLRSSLHAAA
jgi:transposase